MRFTGKLVAVTGASSGLGWAMAHAFSAEGAKIAILDMDEQGGARCAASIRQEEGEAECYTVDVSDETATLNAFAQIESQQGDVDVLVNCAGIAGGVITKIMDLDTAILRRAIDVNLLGPLFCSRAVRPQMVRRGGGAIINISSMSSFLPTGAYSLTKGALDKLTVATASELAPDGIRVNSIAPGRMESAHTTRTLPETIRTAFREAQMIKRAGTDTDIARAALFLASAQDAGFITAQVMLVDGGFISQAPKKATSG